LKDQEDTILIDNGLGGRGLESFRESTGENVAGCGYRTQKGVLENIVKMQIGRRDFNRVDGAT
jgi:hypothetical protein